MRSLILATAIALGLTAGMANAEQQRPYQPPAQNYYQNHWLDSSASQVNTRFS